MPPASGARPRGVRRRLSVSVLIRISLGRAHLLAREAGLDIRRALPVDDVVPIGGIRRFAPDMSGAGVLVIAPASQHATIRATLPRLECTAKVTVHVTTPEHAGAALIWHTGPSRHVQAFNARASRFGLELTDGCLRREATVISTPLEADCYAAIELPLIPPELRHAGDEIAFAAEQPLPALVTDADIRGDLHMHTSWSDGRDSVDAMVTAALQLGYQYLAITDHSERALSARKLRADDVSRQRAEIDQARERFPGIHILHGVEVDIMHDGSLDFDDRILSRFDIVLASLHDHAGHDGARLTERYLSAVRHPLVSVITHPANRAPGQSAGYDLDFDELFGVAAETGTAVEIDGAPGHLDLDGELARRAAQAGVTLAIDSDAHRAEWLGRQMRFGVGTARRGWVEASQVLNTRDASDVRAFIARKRQLP